MGIGPLHQIVVFKKNTPTTLGAGKVDGYATFLTTRGRLKKLSGNRGLSFAEIVENNSYELYVRYESLLSDNLSVTTRVVIDSRTFTVNSWDKITEKNFYYKIMLSEQRN